MAMNLKKLAPPLATVLIILALSACSKKEESSPANSAKTGPAEVVRPVNTIQITLGNVGGDLYLPADVRPRFEQRYAFRVNGKIAQRKVEVGQTVSAGQILAVMDSSDVMPAIAAQTAQVEAAKTDVTLQQAEFKRVQELSGKGFLSTAALDRQKASTDAALARLKAAQSQLASVQNSLTFQTLKADKAGIVTSVEADASAVVAAGQTVVRVAQLGEKELVVSVPEKQIKALREATQIIAVSDAVSGKVYGAKLRELAPTADPASRTYLARLSILNPDENLRLGMSASVRIGLGQQQSITVPNTALYTRDNVARVWVVDKATETVRAVEVQLGASTDSGVVITQGLKVGDVVVTAGANLLLQGQKIRLLGSAPTASKS